VGLSHSEINKIIEEKGKKPKRIKPIIFVKKEGSIQNVRK
jgi:hypothetical protein